MVQVLSKILGLIIAVAESFAKVFGKKETQIEIEARGAQEVEQGLGAGADYSKQIKKNLAGFDELNNLSADSGSSGGGGYDASIDLGLNPDELYNIDEIIQTSVDDGKKILQDFFLWIEDNW